MSTELTQAALAAGFTHAAELDPATLKPMQEVRDMCAADKCHAYNRNWTCPPVCGTLEECTARMSGYRSGVLVQTVGQMEDAFDYETMMETEEKHLEAFRTLAMRLRKEHPDALCLGSGGCRICKKCTYPGEPCRFPDRAYSSMEAYGLLVSQVCTDNGLPYNHGSNTIAYTACILLR